MSSELLAFVRARLDQLEAHALKDLWCLDRASSGGLWTAAYGHNLPYSRLDADGQPVGRLVAHRSGLADGAEDQHVADAMLVARLVKRSRERARWTMADVQAKRAIVDLAEQALADASHDAESEAQWFLLAQVVWHLAESDVDHSGFRPDWRPA
jgi:hypothetical protein